MKMSLGIALLIISYCIISQNIQQVVRLVYDASQITVILIFFYCSLADGDFYFYRHLQQFK